MLKLADSAPAHLSKVDMPHVLESPVMAACLYGLAGHMLQYLVTHVPKVVLRDAIVLTIIQFLYCDACAQKHKQMQLCITGDLAAG